MHRDGPISGLLDFGHTAPKPVHDTVTLLDYFFYPLFIKRRPKEIRTPVLKSLV